MSVAHDHLVIGPELAGTLMTPEEFDSTPQEEWEEGYAYQLINGVLIASPPPSEGERGPNELLGYLLYVYRTEHPQGSALDYTLGEHTIACGENRRRADRVIWAGLARKPNVRSELPTIAVEFVSPGWQNRRRDDEAKRDEYLGMGIQEYWIIDRFHRKMTVVRGPADAPSETVIGQEGVFSTPLLPGFELLPGLLFGESDRLVAAQRE